MTHCVKTGRPGTCPVPTFSRCFPVGGYESIEIQGGTEAFLYFAEGFGGERAHFLCEFCPVQSRDLMTYGDAWFWQTGDSRGEGYNGRSAVRLQAGC